MLGSGTPELGPPPCRGPAQLGGAGGEVGPDRRAGGGGQPRRLLELPEWHSSGPVERLERAGGLMHLAGQQVGWEQRVPGL